MTFSMWKATAVLWAKTGSDVASGKVTYPSLLGIENARAKLAEHIEAAAAAIEAFDSRALPLRVIARYIMDRKS